MGDFSRCLWSTLKVVVFRLSLVAFIHVYLRDLGIFFSLFTGVQTIGIETRTGRTQLQTRSPSGRLGTEIPVQKGAVPV